MNPRFSFNDLHPGIRKTMTNMPKGNIAGVNLTE